MTHLDNFNEQSAPARIVRHPGVEALRANILEHAKGLRIAVMKLETALINSMDDNDLLHSCGKEAACISLQLGALVNKYQECRDIQGIG